MSVIICDSQRPGIDGGVYHLPYIEAVDGKLHGHRDKHGRVKWTHARPATADPKCPACNTKATR